MCALLQRIPVDAPEKQALSRASVPPFGMYMTGSLCRSLHPLQACMAGPTQRGCPVQFRLLKNRQPDGITAANSRPFLDGRWQRLSGRHGNEGLKPPVPSRSRGGHFSREGRVLVAVGCASARRAGPVLGRAPRVRPCPAASATAVAMLQARSPEGGQGSAAGPRARGSRR